MATKVYVAPYVRGPEPAPGSTSAIGGRGWRSRFKSLRRWLAGVAPSKSDIGDGAPTAAASFQETVTNWAYRVTNYRQLRSAGVLCVISPPHPAAGISSYLDLEAVKPCELRETDVFLVESDQVVPVDGTILEGIAMVDEAPVTGQSAPVVRSAEGDSAVMHDSRVVDGRILVQVAPQRGHRLDWIDHPHQAIGLESAVVAGSHSRSRRSNH